MDFLTAHASCAVPTADESNHSATGMLHAHHTNGHMTSSIVSHDKYTPNLNLADKYSKKVKLYILLP